MTYLEALDALFEHLERLPADKRMKALESEIGSSLHADDLDLAARRVKARCIDLGCDPAEACSFLASQEDELRRMDERHPLQA